MGMEAEEWQWGMFCNVRGNRANARAGGRTAISLCVCSAVASGMRRLALRKSRKHRGLQQASQNDARETMR